MRKAARWAALALVAVAAVLGSINAFDELGAGETPLQKTVGIAVAVYAICSWLVLFAAWRRHSWGIAAAVLWTVATAWAASVSSHAYGGAPAIGVVSAGGSCLLMGWWIVWALRETLRTQPPAPVAASESRT